MPETGIASVIITALTDFVPQMTLVAAAAIGATLVLWGIPRGIRFFKKVTS